MTRSLDLISMWANALNNNPEWKESLNSAFDKIGFDREFIEYCRKNKDSSTRIIGIKDHVWGMIELYPSAKWLLDGPLLQRLRSIKQLGFSYLTYPNANHTRFEHCLGVYHVADRLFEAFRQTERADPRNGPVKPCSYEINTDDVKKVLHAALLHDIGHCAFSHASERFFESKSREVKVGPFSVREFQADFLRKMLVGTEEDQTSDAEPINTRGKRKHLSELLSAAIVVSERFREYYDFCPGRPAGRPETLTCELAALILGYPISDDDRALPQILSGPFDADKIDYMIRDARACGLSLGIDISRIFFRAGVYLIADPNFLSDTVKKGNPEITLPAKLFIIDQSGTDAIQELSSARLSLYTRVYHHHTTRNAEAQFHLALAAAQHVDDTTDVRDVLEFWTNGDSSVIDLLSRSKSDSVRNQILTITKRRLLKRSAALGNDLISIGVVPGPSNDALTSPNNEVSDIFPSIARNLSALAVANFAKALAKADNRLKIAQQMSDACKEIRSRLAAANVAPTELPPDDEPPEVMLLPQPDHREALLPQALILTPSRHVVLHSYREASYVDAGRIAQERCYALTSPAWREIGLLAFQLCLYREHAIRRQEPIKLPFKQYFEGKPIPFGIESAALWTPHLEVLYRPILDIEAAAADCRVDLAQVGKWQTNLSASSSVPSPLEFSPRLIRLDVALESRLNDLYQKFSIFQGESNWTIKKRADGMGALHCFTSQFPVHLRPSAIAMLESFEFLNRNAVNGHLTAAFLRIPTFDTQRWNVAPLSPSSGTLIRSYLKDVGFPSNQVSLFATLEEALAGSSDTENIVVVDDNIASGTQASAQVNIWFNKADKPPKENSNYFREPLADPSVLNRRNVRFIFALGNPEGCARLKATCDQIGLSIASDQITFGEKMSDHSGRADGATPIDSELRDFLRGVGHSVIRQSIDSGKLAPDEAEKECARKALGYDNLEGLVSTPWNVPTSTYTAIWRPGVYKPSSGSQNDIVAWHPLLIRQGMLRDVVIS